LTGWGRRHMYCVRDLSSVRNEPLTGILLPPVSGFSLS
jgi:hypothetical protein